MQKIRRTLASPYVRLSFGLVMLTVSVLLIGDVFRLRPNADDELRQARKTVSETLAVQLSAVAATANRSLLEYTIAQFVNRNPDAEAAALVDHRGLVVASFGAEERLASIGEKSTTDHVNVPIFKSGQPWGAVKIAFSKRSSGPLELQYFLFVALAMFVLFVFFMKRALRQMDPSNVVPERVNNAFDALSEGVVLLDDKLRIMMANHSLAELVGKSPADMIGRELSDWPWEQSGDWQAPWRTVMQTGIRVNGEPLRLKIGDDLCTFTVNCAPIVGDDGKRRGVLVTFDDMTAIETKNSELANALRQLRRSQDAISKKNKELETLATQDSLTGLNNRRAFFSAFEKEFHKSRIGGRPLSCVMVDIDHFKKINDSFGHAAGDDVIRAVAQTVQRCSRDYDISGRYGGEEFAVVLPDTEAAQAYGFAERLREAIALVPEAHSVAPDSLTASVGVASLVDDVENTIDFLERADRALYVAKNAGRNQVVQYTDGLDDQKPDAPPKDSVQKPESTAPDAERIRELEALASARADDIEQFKRFDALTGAPNRSVFMEQVESQLLRAKRYTSKFAIVTLNVPDVKRLSAALGYAAVDNVIVQLVNRLQQTLRQTDSVCAITREQSLSRLTSSDYGMILNDLNSAYDVTTVLTRIRRALNKPFEIDGQNVRLGANIGIAVFPDNGERGDELLVAANRARLKAEGSSDRVSYAFASSDLDKDAREYVRIESGLHKAIRENEFETLFQPKFDLALERICGAEALVRWNSPERGLIMPGTFIPIAESNGLIDGIFDCVLSDVIVKLIDMQKRGLNDVRFSVNVSPVQLRDRKLVLKILRKVDQLKLDPSLLEIELTETSAIANRDNVVMLLRALRKEGIVVSLDDFGKGYSSLSILSDLPLDYVKIDRTFVQSMSESIRGRAIVESIIGMAQALGLRVVAEGVETNDQVEMLSTLGCHEVQGYLVGKPMTFDQLEERLQPQRSENNVSYLFPVA